jgi:hypothetical protein
MAPPSQELEPPTNPGRFTQPVLERFTEGRETARYRTVPVVGLVAVGLAAGFIVTLFVYF